MIGSRIVKTLVILGVGIAAWPTWAQNPSTGSRPPIEVVCTATDVQEKLPAGLYLKIISFVEIEASLFERNNKESKAVVLKRVEIPEQPRVAFFPVGGLFGISGSAKLFMTKTALQLGEIGTVMIVNESSRERLAYQCSKTVPATFWPGTAKR